MNKCLNCKCLKIEKEKFCGINFYSLHCNKFNRDLCTDFYQGTEALKITDGCTFGDEYKEAYIVIDESTQYYQSHDIKECFYIEFEFIKVNGFAEVEVKFIIDDKEYFETVKLDNIIHSPYECDYEHYDALKEKDHDSTEEVEYYFQDDLDSWDLSRDPVDFNYFNIKLF